MSHLLESIPLALLVVASYLYFRAYRRCRRRRRGPIGASRLVWFLFGVAMIVVALFSPLEGVAGYSLAGHMLQHVLLLVAPLPLLMARTGTGVLLGIERPLRQRLAGPLHRLVEWISIAWRRPVAWVLLMVTLAMWHLPAVFEAAAVSPILHAAEHLLFFAGAGLWWLSLVGTGRSRRGSYGASLVSVFATMLVATAAGALLTFSTSPWYPLYAARAGANGVDWLADQQMAGLIMWIPPGIIQLGAFVWLAASWLRSVDHRVGAGEVT